MPTNPGVSEVVDKDGVTADIEAKRFDGTRSYQLQGDVTGSQTWSGDSSTAMTIATSIGAKKVTTEKINDGAVGTTQLADDAVTLSKIDDNAVTNTATAGDTRLITAGGVRNEIDSAILNRGKDYPPMTPTEINAITETIPTGSTVHVTASGTITDGNIEVRAGEDLRYYRDGNTHYWYSLDGEFKLKQNQKSIQGLGTTKTITSLSQDENGEMTASASEIQRADTSHEGLVQLTDSHTSTSTTTAATPKNVKEAYDLANGKYSKPSGGIPKNDLASGVQASLDKADSALQGVKLEGASSALTPDSNKVVTVPNAVPTGTGETNGLMTAADKKKLDELTPQADMTDRLEAIAEALCDLDARTSANEEAVSAENLGDRTADSLDVQVLKVGGESVSGGATKVEDSETNGNIKIDGVETNVYTHPSAGPSSATSVGDTTNQTPAFGGTFKSISQTVNTDGHTTATADHTVTLPTDGKDLTSTVTTENNYTNPGSTATVLKTLFGKIWNFIGRLRTSWQTTPDDTHFPSEKLVKDSLDAKADADNSIAIYDAYSGNTTQAWYKLAERSYTASNTTLNITFLGTICNNASTGPLSFFIHAAVQIPSEAGSSITIRNISSSPISNAFAINIIKNTKIRLVVTGTSGNATVALYLYQGGSSMSMSLSEVCASGVSKPAHKGNWTYNSYPGSSTPGETTEPTGTSYKDMTWVFAKELQTAVTDPTASGTALSFIDSITQNENGEITPTKKSVPVDSTPTAGSSNPVSSGGVKTELDGKVSGPSSATADDIVLFDGATGKLVKDSGKKLSDKQDTLTWMNDTEAVQLWADAKAAALAS